jgi:hypothetical protein
MVAATLTVAVSNTINAEQRTLAASLCMLSPLLDVAGLRFALLPACPFAIAGAKPWEGGQA